MPIFQHKFDQEKINKLKDYLEDMKERGKPFPYEIFVDGFLAVPKTDDTSQFDYFDRYVDENTEKVKVKIYNTPLSPRNDQHVFFLGKKSLPLDGIGDVDTIIQDRLAARDREYQVLSLQKELQAAKKDLDAAEEEIEALQNELEEVRAGRRQKQMTMVDVFSGVLESFVRRNPQMLAKIPGAEALAGLIEQDNHEKGQAVPAAPIPEASFQKKPDAGLTQNQLRYIETLRQLEGAFTQPDLEKVMQVVARFVQVPETLETVFELLFNNQNS